MRTLLVCYVAAWLKTRNENSDNTLSTSHHFKVGLPGLVQKSLLVCTPPSSGWSETHFGLVAVENTAIANRVRAISANGEEIFGRDVGLILVREVRDAVSECVQWTLGRRLRLDTLEEYRFGSSWIRALGHCCCYFAETREASLEEGRSSQTGLFQVSAWRSCAPCLSRDGEEDRWNTIGTLCTNMA